MLGWPFSKHRFHLLPEPFRFTTGTRPETLVVGPILSAALLALASWAAVPGADQAAWHAVAGAL
jgi:hypothetical protein